MEITFRTRKLSRNFNSSQELRKEYGDDMARVIQRRMAVLSNSPTLSQVPTMPPERRHLLSGNRTGQYAIDLTHPYRLIFKPDHNPAPVRSDGGIDTDLVTAIVILEVADYH